MIRIQQTLRVALEDTIGKLQVAQALHVSPTLVIGLGGSGVWTVRRLKRLMRIRYGDVPLIRFLLIDADQGAFAPTPELAEVPDIERAMLGLQNPEQIYRDAQNGVGDLEKLQDWLPDNLPIHILRSANGVGGIRPVGRFAFFAALDSVLDKLRTALNTCLGIEQELQMRLREQARNLHVDTNQIRVYIVGSLCGGTGSSLFLDTAVLTRELLHQLAPNAGISIVGVFYLPAVFENEPTLRNNTAFMSVVQANGYAALKELEYFCDSNLLKQQPFTFRYPSLSDIVVDMPVYDEGFLLERGTADGRMLASRDEVLELAARALLIDIGSPVGARVRAARANSATVLQMDPCPKTQKLRLVHSLGVTALSVPIVDLLEHGTIRQLRHFVMDEIVGQSLSSEELQTLVDGFLQSNQLEERFNRDDVSQKLLSETYTVRRTRVELEREAGGDDLKQAHYAAEWVQREMYQFQTDRVQTTRRTVAQQRRPVLEQALQLIRERANAVIHERGLRAASQFIGELIVIYESVHRELLDEQQAYDQDIRGRLENEIGGRITFLTSLRGISGRLKALGNADEQAIEDALRTLEQYGNYELQALARQAVLEILDSDQPIEGVRALIPQLKEWHTRINQAIAKVEEIDRRCAEILSARVYAARTGSTYVLDQWIIAPDEFQNYLQRAHVDIAAYRDRLWRKLGTDLEQRLNNLTRQSLDDLIADLVGIIGEQIQPALRAQVSLSRLIQERANLPDLLTTMLNTCQPFWSASGVGVGNVGYQTFLAATVPAIPGEPDYERTEQWLRDQPLLQNAEIVHSGYPFAIEMMKRVYGARAFWLQRTRTMRHHYTQKRGVPQSAGSLHLDKRFLEMLPDLYENVE
ncbi:MAG: tubulin-like doman-containing protein [Fimbriimonadales bacterium]